MQRQVIGLLIVILYVALSAGQGVFVGHFSQHISPTTLSLYCFVLVTLICYGIMIVKRQLNLAVLRENAFVFLMLNVTTVGTWLGFFISVKYIEPAIAAIIIGSIGPAFVSLLAPLLRPGSTLLKAEKLSMWCFIGIAIYIGYIIFSGKTAAPAQSITNNIIGIVTALISSCSVALLTIYTKKLYDKKVSTLHVLSYRFFLLIFASLLLTPHADLQLIYQPHVIRVVIVFGLIGCLLPVYLIQIGMKLLEPIMISFLMALEPTFAMILQYFDQRLVISIHSLTIVIISTTLSVFAIMGRLQQTKKDFQLTT